MKPRKAVYAASLDPITNDQKGTAEMQHCVALVRGINVGGKKLVGMSGLRDLFVAEGMESPRTLLQSGNVVFSSGKTPAALEKQFERAARQKFGHELHFLVRTAAQWCAMIEADPLSRAAKEDPSHVVAMCLRERPTPRLVAALKEAVVGREVIHAEGDTLFIHYPDGIGTSKLTHALIERRLGVIGTARNWNTVLKIAALLHE